MMPRGFRDEDRADLFGPRHAPRAGDGEAQHSELVDIAAELLRETDKAWLISDGKRETWIPKSQAERDGQTFTLPAWLAIEKGLM